MIRSSPVLAALAPALIASSALLFASDDAQACGGFFARGPDVPALEVEQTLIVYDSAKQMEHFVREVSFRKGNVTFGFVVPTPSRPEVAKVDDAPFRRLHDEFPFMAPAPSLGLGGVGSGASGGAARGVQVLSQQKLGSFTAFVLAATDASGLTNWLRSNHFETTPASSQWLQHYVGLHFYFVAFRFDPPSSGPAAKAPADAGASPTGGPSTRPVSSETMRISFATPLPYYPYLEPDHPDSTSKSPRVLDVWFVSPQKATPVAAVEENANQGARWKRPWLEGADARAPVTTLKTALGPSLARFLPAPQKPAPGEPDDDEPSLYVQVFEDQKMNRHGFGDVVFVPNAPVTLDDAALAKRRAFFSVLDPARGAQ